MQFAIRSFSLTAWTVLLLLAGSVQAESKAPLADAAEQRNNAAVRELIADGADVNAAQVDGMTALHWAVHHNDVRSARRLLQAGAQVAAKNRYGITPLALACVNGNAEIVKLLLDAGADPHATLPGGETVLMTAARTGRVDPVIVLLERGADVNAAEPGGQTALMWAAADGHLRVVDALIRAGAEVNAELDSGFTPFFFAVREGRTDVVLRLIEAGVDVNDGMRAQRRSGGGRDRGTTALLLAVENGHFETALALLKAGADPNASPAGYTALHAITWVRKPLRGDTDPPPIGSGRLTSLDMVRHLVEHGARIDARLERGDSGLARFTTTGCTPFILAARTGDLPLVRLLVELGADPNLKNADDCTALMAAAGVGALGNGDESAGTEEEAIETVRYLLELGLDVNAVDDNGETAMHGAANQSWPRMVQFLADHGADVKVWNRPNKAGWTPLLVAVGYRPGNFRPHPETRAAIERVMRSQGVEPPKDPRPENVEKRKGYPDDR